MLHWTASVGARAFVNFLCESASSDIAFARKSDRDLILVPKIQSVERTTGCQALQGSSRPRASDTVLNVKFLTVVSISMFPFSAVSLGIHHLTDINVMEDQRAFVHPPKSFNIIRKSCTWKTRSAIVNAVG